MDSAQAPNIPQENARRPGCFNLATFPGFLIDQQTLSEPNSHKEFIFLDELIFLELRRAEFGLQIAETDRFLGLSFWQNWIVAKDSFLSFWTDDE